MGGLTKTQTASDDLTCDQWWDVTTDDQCRLVDDVLDGGDESLRIAFVTANERKMTETTSCTNQLDREVDGDTDAVDEGIYRGDRQWVLSG